MSKFKWADAQKPITERKRLVGAENPCTHMVEHIYKNVICAAQANNYYNMPNTELARIIGKALDNPSVIVAGYKWKTV